MLPLLRSKINAISKAINPSAIHVLYIFEAWRHKTPMLLVIMFVTENTLIRVVGGFSFEKPKILELYIFGFSLFHQGWQKRRNPILSKSAGEIAVWGEIGRRTKCFIHRHKHYLWRKYKTRRAPPPTQSPLESEQLVRSCQTDPKVSAAIWLNEAPEFEGGAFFFEGEADVRPWLRRYRFRQSNRLCLVITFSKDYSA